MPVVTRPGARTLTREKVVAAAAAIVDERGVETLNMRLLAERLGVSSMTPYRYVESKEDLLGALADQYMSEVELPGDAMPWDTRVRAVFRSLREVLLRHPALAAIVAVQRVNGPASYRGAEVVLSALDDAGLTPDEGVGMFAALSAFTVGFVQQEIPIVTRLAQHHDRVNAVHDLPPGEFPHIARSAEAFIGRDTEAHFELGLDALIAGIRARAS
jgi:AcrR family transcriptional regulator